MDLAKHEENKKNQNGKGNNKNDKNKLKYFGQNCY